jgi:putative zinc finger/helix-turn-helix YgiT family protein
MNALNCPKGHGTMELRPTKKEISFKGVDLTVDAGSYVCLTCGLEAGTTKTAGALQHAIADAYRIKQGLLTGDEIRDLRKARNLTQRRLSETMNIGIASIKRWETGTVQSASMDRALRMQLQYRIQTDNYSGNREISLERIKLVARQFEKLLGKKLLKKGDRFLHLAKYLWYADFLCFRQLGRSLTGASYAAITFGPQLNNYKDLIAPIKEADSNEAEPLSHEELQILKQIAEKFPEEQMVYEAAHRENVWKEAKIGALIPYSCAHEITEIIFTNTST